MANLAEVLGKLHRDHGPSGIILLQILGWATFLCVYYGLHSAGADPAALARRHNVNGNVIWVLDKGGVLLVAYIINRLLAPFRFAIAKALLPSVSAPINAAARPVMAMLGFNSDQEEDAKFKRE
ncbi:hypothetical protein HDU77_008053 [Chytriomyces hyalinus]|nr:hypothetical protein HDU77_008053 [Chytriomyces hyalinus]